ncbi:MAG: nucleotide pyrophosphohydrolase [Spirochaetes bacterium]|nr:nucleotide pyrophosphohydrolase [Spirochaetota bacterium]
MDDKATIGRLKREVISFRDERNWQKFHDPKNLSMALSVESSELQELFLWKSEDQIGELLLSESGGRRVREELADIFIYLLYISERCGIDLSDAVLDKIKINRKKYPVDKSYDSNRKYTEFGGE